MKLAATFILAFSIAAVVSCGKKHEADSKAVAQEENKEQFDDRSEKDDAAFAVAATDGALLEIELGKLAATRASAEEIRILGQTVSDDHGRANAELGGMIDSKGISVPATLSAESQKKFDELSAKKGAEFDQAYAAFMVNDHQEEIEAYKKQATNGTDPDLKAWAARKVPILQHHLTLAQNAQKIVSGK
jgi:putative membrane protein